MKTAKITAVILATIFVMGMFQLSVPTTAAPTTIQTYPGGGPIADELLFKIYTDEIVEYLALKANQIDLMDWPIDASQIPDAIAERDAGHLNLSEQPDAGMYEFTVNCRPAPSGTGYPLNDTQFRRVLAYMVNKADIVATPLGGYGYVMESPVPKAFYGAWSYEDYVAKYPYSLVSANATLHAAGYTYSGTMTSFPFSGGTWTTPKATPLRSIDILARSDDNVRLYAGRQLRDSFIALNMPVTIRELDSAGCRAIALAEPNDDWDLWTSGWGLGADPDYLWSFFHSASTLNYNTGGFANSDYDYWADKFLNSPTYADTLTAAHECQRILCLELPYISLYQKQLITAARTEWKNWLDMTGYGFPQFWSMLEANPAGQAYGGSMRCGLKQGIGRLHPVTAEWWWDWQVLGEIYDGLWARNPYTLAFQPWLAEQYEVITFNWTTASDSEQGMKVAFTLRDNLTWHDGIKVTADDVRFTYEWLNLGPERGGIAAPRYVLAWPLHNVSVYDQFSGAIFINATSYFAISQLAGFPLIPEHVWSVYHSFAEVQALQPERLGLLIGTGPYAFSEYVPGEYVKLKAFTNYFRTPPARPKLALGTLIVVPKGTPAVLPIGKIIHNATVGDTADNRIDNATLAGSLWISENLTTSLVYPWAEVTFNTATHEYSLAFDTSFLDLGTYTAFVSAGYNVTAGGSSKTYLYSVQIVAPTEWYATGVGLFAIGATVAAVLVTAVLGYSLLKARKALK